MKENNIYIFPWDRPFLPALKAFVEERTGGRPDHALIIFPNKRPMRYMANLFAQDKKAAILPGMLDFPELARKWSGEGETGSLNVVNRLDQVAALHDCLAGQRAGDKRLAAKFAAMEIDEFLPWGLRLADLLEDLARDGGKIQDIPNLDSEVGEPAAILLGALGSIGQAWEEKLKANGWTTEGYVYQTAREKAQNVPEFIMPGTERPVFISGFSELREAENALLKALWQQGAYMCVQADEAMTQVKSARWECAEIFSWIKKWGGKPVLCKDEKACPGQRDTRHTFFAGYDSHSQLEEMRNIMERGEENGESTAIVLCDEGLLMGALHHLPGKDINVSMGYPLNRSNISYLFEVVFDLQINRLNEGLYYWRDLLRLFHSPFFKSLKAQGNEEDSGEIGPLLRRIETRLRQGTRFVSIRDVFAELGLYSEDGQGRLLAEFARVFIENPGKMNSTRKLGEAILDIRDFIQNSTHNFWNSFPLEAEALERLAQNTARVLRDNVIADNENLSIPVLKWLFGMLTRAERVPFEADPIVGLQIMGMLETRLLSFDNVILLDATDDLLPGNPPQDPLLPDSLRFVLGLPDARSRERVAAYNLRRLCAGAKNVHFLWQEGISHSRLFDGKKIRSRFIEEFLWREEEKRKKILEPGEEPLRASQSSVSLKMRKPMEIEIKAGIREKLDEYLDGKISATTLNKYFSCPISFCFNNIMLLKAVEEVNEGDDAVLAGNCLHNVLREFHAKDIDSEKFPNGTLDDLLQIFHKNVETMGLKDILPPHSYIVFEIMGEKQLKTYFETLGKKDTIVKNLEKEFNALLKCGDSCCHLYGKLDRIDEREGRIHILDYKTGNVAKMDDSLWKDGEFFARLEKYNKNPEKFADNGDELLEELRGRLASIQLPFYLTLLRIGGFDNVVNAAYVKLKDTCAEKPLFNAETSFSDESMNKALDACQTVIAFIIQHMRHAKKFMPVRECDNKWCGFKNLCQRQYL